MLFKLHQVARRLWPLRRWCLVLALLSAGAAGLALTESSAVPSTSLRLGLLFALWMLLLYSFIHLFQQLPSPVLPKLPWWERMRQHLHLWFYRLLGVAVGLTGAILLSITVKLWVL